MKRDNGFTLLELMTVMIIIAVLAALVLKAAGYAQNKAARSRAASEIAAMSTALESYKADNGEYPSNANTNLSPKVAPSTENYQRAILHMVTYLCGPSALPTDTEKYKDYTKDIAAFRRWKSYGEFPGSSFCSDAEATLVTVPNLYKKEKKEGKEPEPDVITVPVRHLVDPFGNPYGYSTAGTFNPTYDLWSYAGKAAPDPKDVENSGKPPPYPWWITNW